jgi:hypothetical protein
VKKLLLTGVCLLALCGHGYAETYTYACQVQDNAGNTHLYRANLDTGNHTITWRGSVYRNVKQVVADCAKACFGNGRVLLSTATQGVASLSVLVGTAPGGDGVEEFDCDLVHK